MHLDPAQTTTIYAALGERVDGTWAAAEVGDFKGRQAGKNDALKVRQGAGIDLFGEKLIIHTAHEFPTANEDFLRLVAVYEAYDDLRKTVARVRYANGEQGIEFLSGARIKYKARTGGGGRGFTKADLVVYDEAQHLRAEHLAASMPTMLANPNFQAWFSGSGGMSDSSQAWALRRRAIRGDGGRLAYTEETAQDVSIRGDIVQISAPDDLMSEESLLRHPGYAYGRVSRESMQTMFGAMGAEKFGREVLCMWEPDPGDNHDDGVIPITRWNTLQEATSRPEASTVRLAFDMTPDRRFCSFGLAGKRDDGFHHVETRDRRPGDAWVVQRGRELSEGHNTPVIVVAGSPGGSFRKDFEAEGVAVDVMSAAEYAEACGRFIDAAVGLSPTLRHHGQPDLRIAVQAARTRDVGDGMITWSRKSTATDITPLTTVTAAFGRLSGPRPKRHVEPYVFFS